MNREGLVSEVEKIAEENIDKKYQKAYKSLVIENYTKFLDNEQNLKDKERLLKILKNVKWYSNYNTDVFFSNTITEILNDTLDDLFIICKNKKTSSCYSIVTNLLMQGKLEENKIIIYDRISKRIKPKEVEKNSCILIVDDYSGSGDTIMSMAKAIEQEYSNMRVLILCYIWQKKAIKRIKRIKNYLGDRLNNCYEIIEEGIILENSYKEKFNTDIDAITYIKNICEDCQDMKLKYGYRKAGAMVTLNGISPNNNISMLWNNNIRHNNCKWMPVFDREYSMEVLKRKKNEYLVRKKNKIFEFYKRSFLNHKITYQEFKVLIMLFNTYSIRKEYIKNALGFDTIEEITEIIEKFVKYGIISYSVENILQFTDRRVIREMLKVDEEISIDVGIIKGTRKQIDKIKPLE